MPPWQSTADQGKACAITCWKALHTHTSFIHPTLSPHRLRRFRLLSRLWCGCCNNMHLRALEKLPFLSRLSGTKTARPIAHPQPSHDHAELVGNVCILHWASKDIRASHEIWIPRDELSPSRLGDHHKFAASLQPGGRGRLLLNKNMQILVLRGQYEVAWQGRIGIECRCDEYCACNLCRHLGC